MCECTGCSFYCSQLCLRYDFTAEQEVVMFYVLISDNLLSLGDISHSTPPSEVSCPGRANQFRNHDGISRQPKQDALNAVLSQEGALLSHSD